MLAFLTTKFTIYVGFIIDFSGFDNICITRESDSNSLKFLTLVVSTILLITLVYKPNQLLLGF